MKQLVVERNNPVPVIWDTPIPQPGPNEVLIRNHYSVVSSGTELASIESANKSVTDKLQDSSNISKGLDLLKKEGLGAVIDAVFPKNVLPLQLGYSSCGEVIQTGKDVKDFHVGDKVVSNGAHAEYVTVNQNLCSRMPDETSEKEAAFTVLGSIALHGLRLSETTLGSKIVVIGLGIVGQLVCRLAEAQGSEVIGIDPDEKRTQDRDNFYTSIEEAISDKSINSENVDAVIITAASSSNEPIEVATRIARNKAKIVVVGDIPLNISRNEFYYKELELVVSKSYGPGRYDKQYEVLGNDYPIEHVRWTENRNFSAFLQLLQTNQLSLSDMISEEIDFVDSPSIYERFDSEDKPLSIVLRYDLTNEPKIDFEKQDTESSTDSKKIKLGIIGAGNFASSTILPILRELKKECEVVGVASSGGLSAEVLARNFKIKNKYSTESEIFESEEIDAVFILTQHHNHAELVIKAVDAGKAVYVEKPLALEVESLTAIEEAMYNAENPKIFLGFNRRFAEATQFIKSKLNTSPANSINFRFSVPSLVKDHWTNMKEIGGGRVVGEAVHAIDLASYLFDSLPQSISASSPIDKENDTALDNQVFININFANGSHAAIQYFSETNQALAKERIEVHGGGNSYIMEDFQMLRYLEGSDDKSKVFSKGKGHKEAIQTFLSYVKGESNNPYTWLELRSVAKAAIYSQDFMNSGSQHSIFFIGMNTSFDIYELNNAVLDAAKTIKDMRDDFTVDSKDAVVDLVTNADLKSEEILIEAISKYFPEDGIISEESDEVISSNGRSWLIDPLDGTVNYANNIPQVAITLTLLVNKVPVQTYVYDIFQENLYEGYTDKGAYKNSKKLEVTKDTSFEKAIIATGFPYDRLEFGEQYIQTFLSILKTTGGVRRFGSAALDVCWVADNKFDGYFEYFMKPWDILGASLILKEAGGVVVDEHESFPRTTSNLLIASNKAIHEDFKSLVLANIDPDLKERFS